MRLKSFMYFQGARANCWGMTLGSVHHWLHKPDMTISWPHALSPQYYVVVTQLHNNC